jgi:hypothetical protein
MENLGAKRKGLGLFGLNREVAGRELANKVL